MSKLSQQVRATIRRRHKAGESYRVIGRSYGVSEYTVAQVCRLGRKDVSPFVGLDDRQAFTLLCNCEELVGKQGLTYEEAAKEIGFPIASVAGVCAEFQIKRAEPVRATYRRLCGCGQWFTTPDRSRRVCYLRHAEAA